MARSAAGRGAAGKTDDWEIAQRKLVLKDYEVLASIGVHSFERSAKQRVLVTVELLVESFGRLEKDHISSVVDYDYLRSGISELLAGRHFELQETLCEEIAGVCFARPEVVSARVFTRKPDVYPDCEYVGVEVLAERARRSRRKATR